MKLKQSVDEVGEKSNVVALANTIIGKTGIKPTVQLYMRLAFLVSYLSQFMSLQPGDVISTGTPPGVGMGQRPPTYLNVGDTLTLGIDRLGTQRQIVVDPSP